MVNITDNQNVGVLRNVLNGVFHIIICQHTKGNVAIFLHALQAYV